MNEALEVMRILFTGWVILYAIYAIVDIIFNKERFTNDR